MRIRDEPWRAIAAALVVTLLVTGASIGGYMIGSPPSIDLDAVRSAAAAEGRDEGLKKGAKEGYARGRRSARKRTYAPAYSAAYREAYTREFQTAGLDPPERIRVPEPR